MSLATWKREFYPTPASKCAKKDALAHVLQKYLGTRKAALKRHGVWRENHVLADGKKPNFAFSFGTCALCKFYDGKFKCKPACPLKVGRKTCFGYGQPYSIWRRTGDPEPMIRALRRAIKKQKAEAVSA